MKLMEKILHLEVPGRLPSWNEIVGTHWTKIDKIKWAIQESILSALQVSAAAYSTRITSAKSSISIHCDTLASYLQTRRSAAKLKRRNAYAKRAKKRKR
jgi:hypothetical protein